jgi:c-di-GMP-binding flagellar brake protein YcgR
VSEEKQAGAAAGQGGHGAVPVDLSKYAMTSSAEIAQHLKSIVASGHMVTVFSNRGRTFILSRLLDVDMQGRTLVFDVGGNVEQNQQMLASDRNVFVCSPEGVKTQFATGKARSITFEGQPAYAVDMPTEVIKLQRREYFRIQAPLAQPVMCELMDYEGGALQLPVYDISLGGVGLWVPDTSMPGFDSGQIYANCVIDLKKAGELRVQLEVRHRLVVQQRNGQEVLRIGCSYVNLSRGMESLVQRYVAQLERERRALMR